MNKTELIAAVAEKTGLTKKDAERVINATTETITETLVKGEKVSVSGFGSFSASPEKSFCLWGRTSDSGKNGTAKKVLTGIFAICRSIAH